MEQTNGTMQKKNVMFSIGSYNGTETRKINKISSNGLFSSTASPPPMPATWSQKSRSVSLNFSDDAASRRNGYSTLPRMKTHALQNGTAAVIDKPSCPPAPSSAFKCSKTLENGIVDKPAYPPVNYKRSMSLEPEQLQHSGRVALTIATYEGEPRTPTRLEFLPQTSRLSRSSSKASSIASTPAEDVQTMNSKLQNELSATLLRSNLRKKNDQETADNGHVVQENGKDETDKSASLEEPKENNNSEQETKEEVKENNSSALDDEFKFTAGNVKKLAIDLNEKMTFKTNNNNLEIS